MTAQTDLFDAMVADVITLTARPDLDAETALAVRTATNNAHLSDAYARDCRTVSVQLPLTTYVTQLDIPTLFPRMRGLNRVQLLDQYYVPITLSTDEQLRIIELGDLYDSFGSLRDNVAYLAGEKLNIRTFLQGYGFLVTYFLAPNVRRDVYDSWIAQLYPDAILYWAASIVLDTNGNEAKAAKYMAMTQQVHIPFLKSSFLLGELR